MGEQPLEVIWQTATGCAVVPMVAILLGLGLLGWFW